MSDKGKLTFELSEGRRRHPEYGDLILNGKVFARYIHRDFAIDVMSRWNTFEEGGFVKDLHEACEAIIKNRAKEGYLKITEDEWVKLKNILCVQITKEQWNKIGQALAKAEKQE